MGVAVAEAELSTSTTQSSSQQTTSARDSSSQNIANNPSLILAFLALSFFTLAMVFVFGFRRYQQMQRWNENLTQLGWGERQAEEEIRIRGMAEKKPQLREVRLDVVNTRWRETKSGGTEHNELSWENLMPLSASNLTNGNRTGIAADSVSLSPPSNAHSRYRSIFRHIRGLNTFRALSPRTENDNEQETLISGIEVAFPVAMPSKHRAIHVTDTNGRRHSQHRELVDYEIGVYDSPWTSTSS